MGDTVITKQGPPAALMAQMSTFPNLTLFLFLTLVSSPFPPLRAVWWPEPCSNDCLCSSMRRSHFPGPDDYFWRCSSTMIDALWNLFLFFFFYSCDISVEKQAGIWTFHLPGPPACTSPSSHQLQSIPSSPFSLVFCSFLTSKFCFPLRPVRGLSLPCLHPLFTPHLLG